MAVAMSILCYDRAYYYETKDSQSVLVGKNRAADLAIPNMNFELSISFKRNEASDPWGYF